MESNVNLHAVDDEVRRLKSAVEKLAVMGEDFPAIARNAVRIRACVKMLELNISDCVYLEEVK
jgi:hypothetical protein